MKHEDKEEEKSKEELLDGLLVSGVLTADEYAKKLSFVQRSSHSEANTDEEELELELDSSGHVRTIMSRRSEEVTLSLQQERKKCMREPVETLRKVKLEVRSCEKSVDNAARNLVVAEQNLLRMNAALDRIGENISKLSVSCKRIV